MSTLLLDPENLEAAKSAICKAELVAIDTEFHSEKRYIPELFLVQIHVPDGDVWVVDGLSKDILHDLGPSLTQTNWLVHGGQQDMLLLHREFGALPEHVFDTQIAAGLCSHDHYPAGLAKLVSKYLGIELPKSETLSDWSKRPLTEHQMKYAAEDVLLLPGLWERMLSAIDHHDRRGALHAACQEHRLRVLDPPPLDDRWTQIGGVEKLTRHQLAILQELSAWREETAIHLNQPPRSILSDALLCQLARTQPADEHSMRSNRRFPRTVIKKYGAPIIGCIQRASKRPNWAWPTFVIRDSHAERTASFLRTVGLALALDQDYAANLILPRQLINQICTTDLQPPSSLEGLLGWRYPLCGNAISAAINGKLALRLGPHGPELC
jgi:ribonuclease D